MFTDELVTSSPAAQAQQQKPINLEVSYEHALAALGSEAAQLSIAEMRMRGTAVAIAAAELDLLKGQVADLTKLLEQGHRRSAREAAKRAIVRVSRRLEAAYGMLVATLPDPGEG